MRDWEELVRERMADLALEPEEKAEVIAEVAAHLEDSCEEMRRQGIPEEEAVQRVLSEAGNWKALQCQILAAKRRGHLMGARVRQLWVPGFLTMILYTLFLAMLRKLGFQPRLLGSGQHAILFYAPWLLSLLLFGALAAYASFRAGGSRATLVLASVFPVLALTGAFLSMFPIGLAIEWIIGSQGDFSTIATALLRDGVDWIVVPGAALLAGGLPVQLLPARRFPSQRVASS